MSIAIALHVLAAVVWVGGMFYAYMAMRPAVGEVVDQHRRGLLWRQSLSRFFAWVWLSVVLLLGTGYWMVFAYFGGMANVGWHVHAMQGLGLIMVLLFLHVWFAPYRRLKQAVERGSQDESLKRIGQIRTFVGINLILGLIVVAIGSGGRYLV